MLLLNELSSMPQTRHVAPPKLIAALVSSCLSIDGNPLFSYSGLNVISMRALS